MSAISLTTDKPLRKLDRFLSTREVLEITGWSRPTLWRQVKRKNFPEPVDTSPQRVGWLESEIVDWQEKLIAARDERKGQKH